MRNGPSSPFLRCLLILVFVQVVKRTSSTRDANQSDLADSRSKSKINAQVTAHVKHQKRSDVFAFLLHRGLLSVVGSLILVVLMKLGTWIYMCG